MDVPYLIWVNVLNESLQGGHPAGSQVAVLEEHPLPSLHGTVHQSLGPGTLGGNNTKQEGYMEVFRELGPDSTSTQSDKDTGPGVPHSAQNTLGKLAPRCRNWALFSRTNESDLII